MTAMFTTITSSSPMMSVVVSPDNFIFSSIDVNLQQQKYPFLTFNYSKQNQIKEKLEYVEKFVQVPTVKQEAVGSKPIRRQIIYSTLNTSNDGEWFLDVKQSVHQEFKKASTFVA